MLQRIWSLYHVVALLPISTLYPYLLFFQIVLVFSFLGVMKEVVTAHFPSFPLRKYFFKLLIKMVKFQAKDVDKRLGLVSLWR